MADLTLVGIDLAKSVFQLQGNDAKGKAMFKKKLSRAELAPFIQQLPLTTIAMEACGGAHFWARKFQGFGHTVRLISPQFVKPFVKGNKNDAADAAAICEAAVRPSMHFVPIKSCWHLDVQTIHRVRERLVTSRTALTNELRAILIESGLAVSQGIETLRVFATGLVAERSELLTPMCRETVADLITELSSIEERIAVQNRRLEDIAKKSEVFGRIIEVRGFGLLGATAIMAAVPDPSVFKNGRQFAAWLGLVPRHSGSGGKNKLGRISKRGDRYLRCLLVHGARSAVRTAPKKNDKLSMWINSLRERRGYNKAAVALANKNARIIWALLANGESYNSTKAA